MYKKYETILPTLIELAQSAGRKILEVYKDSENWNVSQKAPDSPLTRADIESNEIICKGLEKLAFLHPIISEENKEADYSERKNWEYAWLIDPLDGTKEFINREDDFVVNIGLVHHGVPILGVVHVPVSGETAFAIKGLGAFLIKKDGTKQKLQVANVDKNAPGLKIICSRSHFSDETKAFLAQYDSPQLVNRGSALKFLMLAAGEAHFYPRLAPTMEWDTCAPQIILEEAGGSVLQYNTNIPVIYNKENLLNPWFLASCKNE
jgi:3'(2'), 5'-bisphosphate nucleotidase